MSSATYSQYQRRQQMRRREYGRWERGNAGDKECVPVTPARRAISSTVQVFAMSSLIARSRTCKPRWSPVRSDARARAAASPRFWMRGTADHPAPTTQTKSVNTLIAMVALAGRLVALNRARSCSPAGPWWRWLVAWRWHAVLTDTIGTSQSLPIC